MSLPTPVFIAHRNRAEACVRSIAAFRAQDVPLEVVVVDNGSRPAELARIAAATADIVRLTHNAGFGPALNAALRPWLTAGGAPFAVLAAQDALPRSGCVRRLLDLMSAHADIGLVAAVSGAPHRAAVSALRGPSLPDHPVGSGFEPMDYPHGTLFVARRACLAQVGVFDERFFAYGCEIELGCRARHAGWRVGALWDAVVDNPETAVPPGVAAYLHARNAIVITREERGLWWGAVRTVATLANTARLALWPARRPRAFSVSARLRGAGDAWRGHMGPPPPDLWPVGLP